MKKTDHLIPLLISCAILSMSCKKMISIDPPKDQLTQDKAFRDSATANALLNNNYALLEQRLNLLLNKYLGVYTDELNATNIEQDYITSRIEINDARNYNRWTYTYQIIYQCNDFLEQLNKTNPLSATLIKQLRGEASFLRAYCYFYLVNLYDHVPLLTVTDVNQTQRASQSSTESTYRLIVSDLLFAQENLSPEYMGANRTRANKWAAAALLARVYLYQKQYVLAEQQAAEVINCNLYTPLSAVGDIFKTGSREQILTLWTAHGYTTDGANFLPPKPDLNANLFVTDGLYHSFENNDLRKNDWIGTFTETVNSHVNTYHYIRKYKNNEAVTGVPEYLSVLRLSEQYLIRAEARLEQNKITGADGALSDLNMIRTRAGLSNVTTADQNNVRTAIETERRHELLIEWGHRFFDLKRSGKLNAVMFAYKSTWQVSSGTFPIPQQEIAYNSNLSQNPGY